MALCALSVILTVLILNIHFQADNSKRLPSYVRVLFLQYLRIFFLPGYFSPFYCVYILSVGIRLARFKTKRPSLLILYLINLRKYRFLPKMMRKHNSWPKKTLFSIKIGQKRSYARKWHQMITLVENVPNRPCSTKIGTTRPYSITTNWKTKIWMKNEKRTRTATENP